MLFYEISTKNKGWGKRHLPLLEAKQNTKPKKKNKTKKNTPICERNLLKSEHQNSFVFRFIDSLKIFYFRYSLITSILPPLLSRIILIFHADLQKSILFCVSRTEMRSFRKNCSTELYERLQNMPRSITENPREEIEILMYVHYCNAKLMYEH